MQPPDILNSALNRALASTDTPLVDDPDMAEKIGFVATHPANRAGVRLLLSAALAKAHRPAVDIRKPYTEIPGDDTYSGRTYDESFVTSFIVQQSLPCNPTTAFLTPALRNRNIVLTPDVDLEGRPKDLYQAALDLLTNVHQGRISAENLLAETIRNLLALRDERHERLDQLVAEVKYPDGIPLSSEAIVTLIAQHLACKNASRLPVLVVAAAYQAAQERLGEHALPLYGHNAADRQTGALGDVAVALVNEEEVVTCYEMKTRRVTREDIEHALSKIQHHTAPVDNYIFVTTEPVEQSVADLAATIYDRTGGTEMVIFDCLGFLRHFLHLFHRLRAQFLEAYQELLLDEPESAVRQELKEAFLILRKAAESGSPTEVQDEAA